MIARAGASFGSSGPYREWEVGSIMAWRSQARPGTHSAMRFIVGILWLILIVFIILVILNVPGIR